MFSVENIVFTCSPSGMDIQDVNMIARITYQSNVLRNHFNRKDFNKEGTYTPTQVAHVCQNYMTALDIYIDTFFDWYKEICKSSELLSLKEQLKCFISAIEDTCPEILIDDVVQLLKTRVLQLPPEIVVSGPIRGKYTISMIRSWLVKNYVETLIKEPPKSNEGSIEQATSEKESKMSKVVERLTDKYVSELKASHGVDSNTPLKVIDQEGTWVVYKGRRVKFERVGYWEMTDEMVQEAVDLIEQHIEARKTYDRVQELRYMILSGDDKFIPSIDNHICKLKEPEFDKVLQYHGFEELTVVALESKQKLTKLILQNEFNKNKINKLTNPMFEQAKRTPSYHPEIKQPQMKNCASGDDLVMVLLTDGPVEMKPISMNEYMAIAGKLIKSL